MFTQDRDRMRQFFCDVWHKKITHQPLQPLENLIAEIIAQHPEHQPLLQDAERAITQDYTLEQGQTNPFLHMGMHIALAEQLSGDRPEGIRIIYQRLCQRYGDRHAAEHKMLEVLGETLWEAQRDATLPDETRYLQRLQQLAASV
jgi:hypothetical protein